MNLSISSGKQETFAWKGLRWLERYRSKSEARRLLLLIRIARKSGSNVDEDEETIVSTQVDGVWS